MQESGNYLFLGMNMSQNTLTNIANSQLHPERAAGGATKRGRKRTGSCSELEIGSGEYKKVI
jgi:hypothetical protein